MSTTYQSPLVTSKSDVAAIQRVRVLAAAASAVEELGYAGATVAEFVSRAGVSRKTFYEAFANREDCFLALFEDTVSRAASDAVEAFLDERHWRAGIRSALCSLLILMEAEPALARLWTIETLQGGERVLERRAQIIDRLAKAIDEGRRDRTIECDPPDVVAEATVGGVIAVLHTHVLRSPGQPLMKLVGRLMYLIVLPYLGEEIARRELNDAHAPVVDRKREPKRVPEKDPLKGLNIRLTYRTVRALVAIADSPGASNREIAHASDIADQGQISKLLSRLASLELVENRGLGHQNGGSNAWHLTSHGVRLLRGTRPGSAGLSI